jgi:hypothetical protein
LTTLASIFIVPIFTLFGYTLRVSEAVATRSDHMPAFEGWWDLTVEGVYGALALTPLYIVTFIATTVALQLRWAVYVLVVLGTSIVAPAFLVVYATERNWERLYTDLKALRAARQRTFLIGVLQYIVVSVLVLLILLVGLFTLVGLLVVIPFAYFIQSAFWGRVYADALDEAGLSIDSPSAETEQEEWL